MEITEIEYQELASIPVKNRFKNKRFGIRIKTTPQNYEQDFVDLVIEVKKKLQQIIDEEKENGLKQIK